jgi:hypothetical protein
MKRLALIILTIRRDKNYPFLYRMYTLLGSLAPSTHPLVGRALECGKARRAIHMKRET